MAKYAHNQSCAVSSSFTYFISSLRKVRSDLVIDVVHVLIFMALRVRFIGLWSECEFVLWVGHRSRFLAK
jgi:hypothetical protein